MPKLSTWKQHHKPQWLRHHLVKVSFHVDTAVDGVGWDFKLSKLLLSPLIRKLTLFYHELFTLLL